MHAAGADAEAAKLLVGRAELLSGRDNAGCTHGFQQLEGPAGGNPCYNGCWTTHAAHIELLLSLTRHGDMCTPWELVALCPWGPPLQRQAAAGRPCFPCQLSCLSPARSAQAMLHVMDALGTWLCGGVLKDRPSMSAGRYNKKATGRQAAPRAACLTQHAHAEAVVHHSNYSL